MPTSAGVPRRLERGDINMTLAFITSVRHPQNSSDYRHVETILNGTLESINRQTCGDYVVIVVGNRRPPFALSQKTNFGEVDFPPPSAVRGPCTGRMPSIWDKCTKLGVGLVAAREFAPDYVMIADADDFVHRDLASYTAENLGRPGWVIKRGLIYSQKRNAYGIRRNLNRICGSSHIVPYDAFNVPANLTVSASQQEVAQAFRDYAEPVLGGHRRALEWWAARGRQLEPLPFPGAVYHVDHGENHSGSQLAGPGLPYRPHLERDFGIRPSKGAASTIWSSIGPAAIKPDLRPRRPFFLRPKASSLESYASGLQSV
jgi:hypothetical protein